MLEFIVSNFSTILLGLAVFFYVFYLVLNKRWEKLRKLAYKFILQAEKEITGTKKGQERFEFVIKELYLLMPKWLQIFITEETLKEKLQEWYNDVKDYLDDGKINNSIVFKKADEAK
ncbi:hypothetical protein EHE19_001660 [Ruminiclostridium herbifermentans]|uniref:Uncharacterized protein n=1 Tax=Ruminiclostridium herbifermentans TaxID=2488810 RepID=A0A4U7J7K0_9FIRM|nr:hypothetical protein [Ruminiclostridium herbifermentans]QNU67278.1 hypothetical protein EHE19_001660 [Ruminiclostridium herbifermentans]